MTSNTYSTVRTITNMCLHYIWVEVPATCAHSSDGSCKVHARLQQEERGGLSIDKKSPSLERDILQRLGIDSITAPVMSIAFMNHLVSHVSPVEPLFSQYSFVI